MPVNKRCHTNIAVRLDLTRVFMELRLIGAHNHASVADQLRFLADRKTDRRLDFDISL